MIRSILDTDLYKLTQNAAVLQLYPNTPVTYEFINRNLSQKFNQQAYQYIVESVKEMGNLKTKDEEISFLQNRCPYLPKWYFNWLKSYRFDPNEVEILYNNGELKIIVSGDWDSTILWEVPLLAIVSDSYFLHVDKNWSMYGQIELINEKGRKLELAGCKFSDFGTRRRRNFITQELVVEELSKFDNFVGTSNPYLAMRFPTLTRGRPHCPKGTMAHEFISAHQVLGGIRHSNRDAMRAWREVYKRDLGTALTDTLGSDTFFNDIDAELAHSFDSLRCDSGDNFIYIDKTIKFYEKHKIDPHHKSIIFSDDHVSFI